MIAHELTVSCDMPIIGLEKDSIQSLKKITDVTIAKV